MDAFGRWRGPTSSDGGRCKTRGPVSVHRTLCDGRYMAGGCRHRPTYPGDRGASVHGRGAAGRAWCGDDPPAARCRGGSPVCRRSRWHTVMLYLPVFFRHPRPREIRSPAVAGCPSHSRDPRGGGTRQTGIAAMPVTYRLPVVISCCRSRRSPAGSRTIVHTGNSIAMSSPAVMNRCSLMTRLSPTGCISH
jgi:hypothetical protein